MQTTERLLPQPANRSARCVRKPGWSLLFAVVFLLSESNTQAKEFALIVGGGSSKLQNHVSLERQVSQAIKVLEQRHVASIDVLFADGENVEPDVVEAYQESANAEPTQASVDARFFRRLFSLEIGWKSKLRNHQVSNVRGSATLTNLEAWFREQGSQLQAGDTLLLYFATHGTLSDGDVTFVDGDLKPSPGGSKIMLWDPKRLSVNKLASLMDQIPPGVQVQLLITACYSGGFAELGWPDRSEKRTQDFNQSPASVAGFFATSSDRPAAGCTSAVDSQEVRDYATCFWSALSGAWPDGKVVTGIIDLNSDGSVSFSEAHAFALVADTTLDTPLKTSDYALRKISRFGRAGETGVLTTDPYYEDLYRAAQPNDRVLLDQLSVRLKLTERHRLSKARMELRRLDFDLRALAIERDELLPQEEKLVAELLVTLTKSFPELSAKASQSEPMALKLMEFVERNAQKLNKALASEPHWAKLVELQVRLEKIDAERLQLEERWAGYQRFLQTAESVILAHNLPLVVEDKVVLERFDALKKAENSPLASTR